MHYKCTECRLTIAANDGRILMSLPPHVRVAYPVEPKYASGTFHFHEDLSSEVEVLMKTYANARFVSNCLYREMCKQYTKKMLTYLSQSPKVNFVTFED